MADLQRVWGVTCLMLEGCCLSLGANNEMRMCLKVAHPSTTITTATKHSET